MDTLFPDTQTFQKERPTKSTPQQLEKFYRQLAKEAVAGGWVSCSDEEGIIESLKELAPFHGNGFDMAKRLEYDGFTCNTELCEWLDGLSHQYRSLIDENVKLWVRAHNPKPKFEKGTKLLINMQLNFQQKKDDVIFVTGFREDIAMYLIHKDANYEGGTYVTYEELEAQCELI